MKSFLWLPALCSVYLLVGLIAANGQIPTENTSILGRDQSVGGEQRQYERRNWTPKRGAKELGTEFGFAPMQPTFLSGRKEYATDGRKFALASVRFGRVIGTVKHISYEYLFEVIPISFAIKNEVASPESRFDSRTKAYSQTVRENTYGIGFQPASFRFIFAPSKRLKPYAQVGAGFIFTNKPIPVPGSPRYNFIGDFGGGLMFNVSEKRTINLGYRYFHISNMNIGVVNPGYNANVFYIGYSLFSK